jgi:hypothetical protein
VIWQVGAIDESEPQLVPQYATRDNFETLRLFDEYLHLIFTRDSSLRKNLANARGADAAAHSE